MPNPLQIRNWRRIDHRITTSGQPSEAQLEELAASGVGTVINLALHTHEEALADEAASVSRLGMTYVHIPVEFDDPTEQDFARFCTAMAEAEGRRVHVHCIMNFRVTAFLYRYERDVVGGSDKAARKAMDSVWRPGGVWAAFIGDSEGAGLPHRRPIEADGSETAS